MNGGLFDGLEKENEIKQFHNHKIEVDGVNITDFLNQNHNDLINKIKFIKTDTEGLDKEVLKTLAPIIKSNKPVLMVEAFRSLNKEEILDFYNVLKSFDYEIYDVSPLDNKTDCSGPLTLEEFEYYIYNIVDNGNFFCFHKDEVSLNLQWQEAPAQMQWFADQEKLNKGTWLDNGLKYDRIKDMLTKYINPVGDVKEAELSIEQVERLRTLIGYKVL
jgi:hypothetical protein